MNAPRIIAWSATAIVTIAVWLYSESFSVGLLTLGSLMFAIAFVELVALEQ